MGCKVEVDITGIVSHLLKLYNDVLLNRSDFAENIVVLFRESAIRLKHPRVQRFKNVDRVFDVLLIFLKPGGCVLKLGIDRFGSFDELV